MRTQVTGIGRYCDSTCPICVSARGRASWLKPVVKGEYYSVAKLMGLLRIPWPCRSREKQTGKKPWE
ncbi:MAG: hypothetical protein ACOC58_01155 [Chloroflexota bacterium]